MKHPIIPIGYTFFLLLIAATGCSKVIDPVVVPLNNISTDLNQTKLQFSMPMDLFPGAKIKFKGHELEIEKKF